MSQLTVGLDLGHDSVKRVILRSSLRTIEVAEFTSVPVPQDERPFPQRVAEVLKQLNVAAHDSDLVATAIPGDEVSIRLLTLPFSDNKRIAQTIGFEIEGQVPFSLDEVVFDYLVSEKTTDGGARLLVALCQVDRLGEWMAAMRDSGVDPRLVGAESLCFASLANVLPAFGNEQAIAVLDIGQRLTSICLIGPTGVEFSRTLSGGGFDMTCQLAEAFKLDLKQAEEGKRRGVFLEYGGVLANTPDQAKVSDAIRRSLATLVREIRQTLNSHRTMTVHPIDKIWLCGGGSAVTNLDHYLSDELALPVETIRPEHLKLPGAERLGDAGSNAWAKALGLSLHAHQRGRRCWLNFRRGAFSFKGDFQFLREKVTRVVIALLIVLFLAIGQAIIRNISLSKSERLLEERIQETTQAILGKAYDNPEVAMRIIKDKVSPGADTLPRITALDALREIHARLPAELKVRLRGIDIKPKKIQIEGFTDSFESVEKIKSSLEKYSCFGEIQTGKTRKTKDESEVEFELSIAVGC